MKNLRNFRDWSINESNSGYYEWVKSPTNITPTQKKEIETKDEEETVKKNFIINLKPKLIKLLLKIKNLMAQ